MKPFLAIAALLGLVQTQPAPAFEVASVKRVKEGGGVHEIGLRIQPTKVPAGIVVPESANVPADN